MGKFRIPRRTWYEHDCEVNAGQLLGKNKNKHRQIAAESLENDTNHENNKISKLKVTSMLKGYLFQVAKLWKELVKLTET